MKKNINQYFLLIIFILISAIPLKGQTGGNYEKKDYSEEQSAKTGWTFGGVPVIAYDRDVGFRYGALVNFYDFGNGSRYPKYDHSIFLQYSRTTRGSTFSLFTFDSDRLIPGIRTAAEVTY